MPNRKLLLALLAVVLASMGTYHWRTRPVYRLITWIDRVNPANPVQVLSIVRVHPDRPPPGWYVDADGEELFIPPTWIKAQTRLP